MRVPLQSTDLEALVTRCRDLEARGFECISKIKAHYRVRKEFFPDMYMKGRHNFDGVDANVIYRCLYEKKDRNDA